MFVLLSFFANIVTDPVSILSPPLLSFPFRRLPESVAFTICICEHKKGWWTKVVCSQPSQVIRRRIPGLRFQITKLLLAVVADMAQHQAQATYQVNVLVRLVRSWFSSQSVVLLDFNIGEASSTSSSSSTQWIADHAQVKKHHLAIKSDILRAAIFDGHITSPPPPTRHFSSNDSNPSLVDLDEGRRSPSLRPRSRSLRYLSFWIY